MANKIIRLLRSINYPSYHIFFVTAICNAKCPMCFYMDNMNESEGRKTELTLEEYEKISQGIPFINVLGISGGEPFIRKDLAEIVKILHRNCKPLVLDLPTNATLVDSVRKQAEEIARSCPDMSIDIQISIDGPEAIHNKIRGLPEGFESIRKTYAALLPIKRQYKNLRVKACVVYSHYNQEHMEELFKVLRSDFDELDRVVFSVAHGTVYEEKSLELDWERYFRLCDQLVEETPVSASDFHSLFTVALRMAKNDVLRNHRREGNFYRHCQAGKKVIVVGETGKVYPCEPLWQEVGDLRENGYDLDAILKGESMAAFQKQICDEKCNCHWGVPMSNKLLYSPSYYPRILKDMAVLMGRDLLHDRKA